MLLVNSLKNPSCNGAIRQCLLGSRYSSSSDDKVRRVWTVTQAGVIHPMSFRDSLIQLLSKESDHSESQKRLCEELEKVPDVEEQVKRIQTDGLLIPKYLAYGSALKRSDREVLIRVSRFDSAEASDHKVCRTSSVAWRALLDAMQGFVGLQYMQFSQSSYNALLFELLKTERVSALSLAGSNIVGQHADDSVFQLMRMFHAKEECDLGMDNIRFLSLAFMGFGDKGCEHISDALQGGVLKNVSSLTLHGNEIGADAALRLCKEAASLDNSLLELDLCLNRIGCLGMKKVERVVLANPNLEVGLAGNEIRSDS